MKNQIWQAEPDGRITTDLGSITIAEVIPNKNSKRNALLISCAPELLEALKEALDLLIGAIPEIGNNYITIKEIEKLIAKTEG